MYTLLFIGYIVISLLIAGEFTKDRVGLDGFYYEGEDTKTSLLHGFLTIPIMGLILALTAGFLYILSLVALKLYEVAVWIFYNMP